MHRKYTTIFERRLNSRFLHLDYFISFLLSIFSPYFIKFCIASSIWLVVGQFFKLNWTESEL